MDWSRRTCQLKQVKRVLKFQNRKRNPVSVQSLIKTPPEGTTVQQINKIRATQKKMITRGHQLNRFIRHMGPLQVSKAIEMAQTRKLNRTHLNTSTSWRTKLQIFSKFLLKGSMTWYNIMDMLINLIKTSPYSFQKGTKNTIAAEWHSLHRWRCRQRLEMKLARRQCIRRSGPEIPWVTSKRCLWKLLSSRRQLCREESFPKSLLSHAAIIWAYPRAIKASFSFTIHRSHLTKPKLQIKRFMSRISQLIRTVLSI
jgi:hypothetical protein